MLEYIRVVFRRNLIDLREGKGLTNTEIAQNIGISQSSYSRYEQNGWISDYEVIEKLAAFYGVKSSQFYKDDSLSIDSNKEFHIERPTRLDVLNKLQEAIDLLNKN